jgi:glycosyltransferase involved in cell wall biosynthesis
MLYCMSKVRLISIIISSYNYGRFLPEAIESALNQTYPHTEVIVVDDGSTDNSREVIAAYCDLVIPVLKENGGQASAFNAGVKQSRGEVICFLDSDDALLPTAAQEAMLLFSQPDVVKVHWPLWALDEQGRKTGKIIPSGELSEGDLREAVVRGGPGSYVWPPTSGSAWARSFIESVCPIPEAEYKVSPDLYLSALAPIFGSVASVPEPQGFWRIHGANNSWRGSFDEWLRLEVQRWGHCCNLLAAYCRDRGIVVEPEVWLKDSWVHRLFAATQEIAALIPAEASFILVDEDQWRSGGIVAGRTALPFPEQDGQYWGPPSDEAAALRELERLRQAGAQFIVFGWPAFWWLDYYQGLREHLRSRARCVLENDRLVVFDLR